jgi:putative transposase
MSTYIHKSHNVSVLIYHLVCPAKYRRVVFDEEVDKTLKEICLEISKRYEVVFLEIGTDLVKSKNSFGVENFWTKGYFISTVGRHGSEDIIGQYVKNQGTEKKYKKLHSQQVQLELF